MKIAIVGAGKLGLKVTEALMETGYELLLIDKNPEVLENFSDHFDILTLGGNAKDLDFLKEAPIKDYDFLIALTGDDEKNMVICSMAKSLGCSKVVARIRDPEYVHHFDFIKNVLKIDFIANPDLSIAEEIYKYLVEKYTLNNGYFPMGKLSILEFVGKNHPDLPNKEIVQVKSILGNMLIVAISRNGKIIIPTGNSLVMEDDYLYVIGEDAEILKLKKLVHDKNRYTDLERVMIAGGGKSGFYLAKALADFHVAVKLIEIDKERCQYLAQELDRVMILNGDATDLTLLEEENIDDMDAFVSVTGYDEENLLLALLANQKNIEDVVAKISRDSYVDLVESMGVSMVMNPLEMAATEILRFIQGSKRILFSKMIQGQAEFVEIVASKTMKVVGKPLAELNLPEGIIVAALHRDKESIIPDGNTVIAETDKVLFFSLISQRHLLEDFIKVKEGSDLWL